MAKKTASAVQLLTVSLIIFVMLTFVLAVTTYVFFAQKQDALVATKTAQDATKAATDKMRAAEGLRDDLLETVVGADDGQTIEALKEELAGQRGKMKGVDDENKNPTFRGLVETLSTALANANRDNKTLTEKRASLEKEVQKAKAGRQNDQDAHDEQLEAKIKELEKVANDRQKMSRDFEQEVSKLNEQLAAANAKAKRLKSLEDEIQNAAVTLAPKKQAEFKAADNNPVAQVAMLLEELKDLNAVINRQNKIFGKMRIASPDLQATILAATPPDDRIDGFDGRIVLVNELEKSVLIRFPRTSGIRPGMLFFVYETGEQLPLMADNKGLIEIVSVESGNLARGRVLDGTNADPIVANDAVATSLWSPLMPLEVVIVGHVRLDNDSVTDDDRVAEMVTGIGGTVAPTVSLTTSLVVDAGEPRPTGGGRDSWTDDDQTRRRRSLEEAEKLGVKVIRIDGFLELLGLEENFFEADSLAKPAP